MKTKNPLSRFYTLEQSNTGKVLYLTELDGTKSEDWLRVAGADSDLYEDGLTAEREELSSDDVKRVKAASVRLYASLVLEWSFDLPCTKENVLELFMNSPFVRRQVIRFVDERQDFFAAAAKP